jgi:acetyl esterase/lipase
MVAEAAGVETTLEIRPGMWHYWHIFYQSLPEARRAMDSIGEFLIRHQALGN